MFADQSIEEPNRVLRPAKCKPGFCQPRDGPCPKPGNPDLLTSRPAAGRHQDAQDFTVLGYGEAKGARSIFMDLQLSGKKVFISGSTQGIGYAIAKALAREGAQVTLNGRDGRKLSVAVVSLHRQRLNRCDGAAANSVRV